jgi:hypothetical protein
VRSLDDRVEKVIGVLVAGKGNLSIEVDGSPVPSLRDDAVKDGLFLQDTLAQYPFEKRLTFNHAGSGHPRRSDHE